MASPTSRPAQFALRVTAHIDTAMNVKKDFRKFAPRVGITYQLDPKTVIRSGYGRSFDIGVFGTLFGHVVTQNLPVLANQNLTNSGANTAAFNLAVGPPRLFFPLFPPTARSRSQMA